MNTQTACKIPQRVRRSVYDNDVVMSTFPSFFTGLYISKDSGLFEMYRPVKKDGKVLINTQIAYKIPTQNARALQH